MEDLIEAVIKEVGFSHSEESTRGLLEAAFFDNHAMHAALVELYYATEENPEIYNLLNEYTEVHLATIERYVIQGQEIYDSEGLDAALRYLEDNKSDIHNAIDAATDFQDKIGNEIRSMNRAFPSIASLLK